MMKKDKMTLHELADKYITDEDVKKKFLANVKESNAYFLDFTTTAERLYTDAFLWRDTSEGDEFWRNLNFKHQKLLVQEQE